MVDREQWKENASLINTLRCSLAERILSLSCWMEREMMENYPFVLVERYVSACVNQNGKSERQKMTAEYKNTQQATDLTTEYIYPYIDAYIQCVCVCPSYSSILGPFFPFSSTSPILAEPKYLNFCNFPTSALDNLNNLLSKLLRI